jgi:hypothetical protein
MKMDLWITRTAFLAAVLVFTPQMLHAADPKGQVKPAVDAMQALPREVATDTNKDGKPDRWERYANGQLSAIEADSNFDGIVDEKGVIQNGKLVKVEKDSDGDGKPDRWVTY